MKNIIAVTMLTLLTITGFYQINVDSADSDFERWALKHGKNYFGDEKTYRQAIYYQNKQIIEKHNKRTDVTYQMGENQFTAITNEEFINLYLNIKSSEKKHDQDQYNRQTNPKSPEPKKEEILGESIDWRGYAIIKNQGNCASSWAVAFTSLMEAEYAIQKKIYNVYSAQQIMDCDRSYQGCDVDPNNTIMRAYQYQDSNGLYLESQYPYTGLAIQGCQVSNPGQWKMKHLWIADSIDWAFRSELKDHPIQVIVDASKWQFYKSGVFSDCSSSENQGNYNAIVVGFEESFVWIVQASFGKVWGESGYIRLAPGDTCGLLNDPHVADLY